MFKIGHRAAPLIGLCLSVLLGLLLGLLVDGNAIAAGKQLRIGTLAPKNSLYHRQLMEVGEAWRAAQARLQEAQGQRDTLDRERERLAWQAAELDKLAPQPHEWDTLNAEH